MARPKAHRPSILVAIAAAAVLALAGVVTAAVAGVVSDGALLPDLRQKAPYDISVRTASRNRVVLTFASAVGNVGQGPLILNGTRARSRATMVMTQEVLHADGSRSQVPVVGGIRYTPFGHNHWHYLAFDAFELHEPVTGAQVAVGHKIGFCLGSRYVLDPPVPNSPTTPSINHNCGRRLPSLTRMRMGLDVGYEDDYAAYLEFQYIDITRVPAGRYVLLHRADPQRRLAVGNRADDVATTLIDIAPVARRGAVPKVSTLAECPGRDGSPNQPCVAPPAP